MYSKEQKYNIGKEAYDKVDTISNIAAKYGTSYMNVRNWAIAYSKAIGQEKTRSNKYDNMVETELKNELMRKDIEIARLKKGYVVKGGGGKKEYDTILD